MPISIFFAKKMRPLFFVLFLPSLVYCQPRVAIFSQPLFPRFGANPSLHPRSIAQYLQAFGISCDLLDANELANPQAFNSRKYFILIYPYGNTFPLDAIENIRAFHSKGGSIIAVSVPFCHPCLAKGAKDWQFAIGEEDKAERVAQSHNGKYSLYLRKGSKNWTIIKSAYLDREADVYNLSAWVKVISGNIGEDRVGDRLFLRFWDEKGNFLGQEGPSIPSEKGKWFFISQDVKVPEQTRKIDVILALYSSSGELLIDDVSLKAKGKRKELLPNGGFELMDGPWEDVGHRDEWLSHNGLGMGGFWTPAGNERLVYLKDKDPLELNFIDWKRYENVLSQTLDPESLPKEDKVLPIAGYKVDGKFYPAIAIIKHNCLQFKGAIDILLGQVFNPNQGRIPSELGRFFDTNERRLLLDLRQVYLYAVLFIFSEKGLISKQKRTAIIKLAEGNYRERLGNRIKGKLVSFPSVFPHSPPPQKRLMVVDVRELADDEKLLLTSLQGIVNRDSPLIYLIFNPVDERWLGWMRERGDISEIERVQNPFSLLARFRSKLRGMVIYDPKVPASIDCATMLAGIERAVIVSPRLVSRLSLPLIWDLRGKWEKNWEVYRWAHKNLWAKLNHQFLVSIPHNWVVMRDYAIEFKAFVFWISGEVDGDTPEGDPLEEQLAIEEILASAPANIGIIGVPYAGKGIGIQEAPGVALWSRYAKFLAWSHIPNLSVHSGTRRVELRQTSAESPSLEDKIYITFLVSDGDAPINWYDFFLWRYWDDPLRGTYPLTWSVGPTVYDLIPDIMHYYYSRAGKNDYFACAFGVGYSFADIYAEEYENKEEIWEDFLRLTRDYIGKMGLDCLWTHHEGERYLRIYGEKLDLKCILADYGRLPDINSYEKAVFLLPSGVPVFRSLTTFDPEGGERKSFALLLEETRKFTPETRPAFMHIFVQCYPMSPSLIKRLWDGLGKEYVPLRPDHLAELFKRAHSQP